MVRPKSYSQRDLKRIASVYRRSILNQIQKGNMIKLTKVMVSRHIAEKLGLKSDRMLWMSGSDSRQFLDEWFDRLKQEIEIIAGETTFLGNNNTGNELERKIKQLKIQIEALLNENKILKEENFHLRMLSFDKFGKADAKFKNATIR